MKNEINDTAKELIAKSLAGEASPEQEKELQEWIAQSPENERYFSEVAKVFKLSEKYYADRPADNLKIDIDAEWNHFVKTISKDEKPTRQLETGGSSRPWLKIAASILLLVSSALVFNYLISKDEIRFETAQNTKVIQLPDGSSVILNRNSTLSYEDDFGKETRTLRLTGEGFFDVTPNPEKTFIIITSTARIEVVGTSFNVLAYDSLEKTEVIVKTGIVKLTVPSLQQEVKLTAGEKGVYAKYDRQLISTVNADVNYLAWNTREIVFTENDLKTVIETLNKAYNTKIIINTEISDTCLLTVKFDHQTLEAVLHVLENTLNLTYRINGNQIEITGAGC